MGKRTPVALVAAALIVGAAGWLVAARAFRATPSGVPSEIKSDEVVRLFPTLARWTEDGGLIVPVHGWIYEPEDDSVVRGLAFEVMEEMFAGEETEPEAIEEAAEARLHRRLALFAADDESGKRVAVRIEGQTVVAEPSTAQGHFTGETMIDAPRAHEIGSRAPTTLRVEAAYPEGDARSATGLVYVPPPPSLGGVAVVCDLDDTVKVSMVRDRRALLSSTLWEEWRAVDGVPDLVRAVSDSTGALTVYLTAARWPMQGEFAEFLDGVGCPPGVFVMREFDFSLRDLRFARDGAEEHKRDALRDLAAALPTHEFVLIGDSTEADPVVYGEFARAHPRRVRAVLIRLVGDDAATDPRFAEAFRGIDPERIVLFASPPAFEDVEALVTTPAAE